MTNSLFNFKLRIQTTSKLIVLTTDLLVRSSRNLLRSSVLGRIWRCCKGSKNLRKIWIPVKIGTIVDLILKMGCPVWVAKRNKKTIMILSNMMNRELRLILQKINAKDLCPYCKIETVNWGTIHLQSSNLQLKPREPQKCDNLRNQKYLPNLRHYRVKSHQIRKNIGHLHLWKR